MKKILSTINGIALAIGVCFAFATASCETVVRDYEYEAYCDSIYENDTDYYYDVLMETDEYQDYIEYVGEWWLLDEKQNCN